MRISAAVMVTRAANKRHVATIKSILLGRFERSPAGLCSPANLEAQSTVNCYGATTEVVVFDDK